MQNSEFKIQKNSSSNGLPQKKILYLDPFSGVSGDMFIGALLDLGLDLAALHHALSKINLRGYQLRSRRVMRGAMAAVKFDVEIDGVIEGPADVDPAAVASEHGHSHGHDHGGEGHSHGEVERGGAGGLHRNFAEIRALIESSALSERVKSQSLAAFQRLAVAEGRIHNMPPESVGFHEVGAVDSIVDMVGACVGLELLGIDELWCGALALGGGFVKCQHGVMPVPAPATLELVKGLPLRSSPVEKELTTPTGAALVGALATKFGPIAGMRVEKIGYGAGGREQQAVPNVLRALLGTADDGGERDTVVEIQANIDDATGEQIGYVSARLMEAGALDVFCTPILMKKSRPATLLTVLAEPEKLDALAGILFGESSTFGLRYQTVSRMKLERRIVTVATEFGDVRVKVGAWGGVDVSVHPEFEDCQALARDKGVALKAVQEAAVAALRAKRLN